MAWPHSDTYFIWDHVYLNALCVCTVDRISIARASSVTLLKLKLTSVDVVVSPNALLIIDKVLCIAAMLSLGLFFGLLSYGSVNITGAQCYRKTKKYLNFQF